MAATSSPWRRVLLYWKAIVTMATPLLLLPLPLTSPTPEARCGYVILLMAVYWMTEALPLPITALLPVVAFPLLGIMSTGELSLLYMKETIMMLLGGMAVAIAVEHSNLHQRIALLVLLHIGQSPRRLMAGFMLTTMFLSMWISNVASAAMMVPIVDSIMLQLFSEPDKPDEGDDDLQLQEETRDDLHQTKRPRPTVGSFSNKPTRDVTTSHDDELPNFQLQEVRPNGNSNFQVQDRKPSLTRSQISPLDKVPKVYMDVSTIRDDGTSKFQIQDRKASVTPCHGSPVTKGPRVYTDVFQLPEVGKDMRKAMLLAVAYSANIGGTGVVTGTGPNLVLMDLLDTCYSEPTGLTYPSWMGFNIPGMLICVILSWIWLQFYFFRGSSSQDTETIEKQRAAVKELVEEKYRVLQSMTFHESVVVTLFACLVGMWVFRAPEFIKGWGYWFESAYGTVEVADATPAMLVVILLFIIPKKIDFLCFKNPSDPCPEEPSEACLNWKVLNAKMPWNVMLLLGGGFAISEAANVSGLSSWLGLQLESLAVMPAAVIVLVVSLLTAMVTEVASNTAAASILLPVLNSLGIGIGVNPLYLMLPATICCSYAFMLPVATPPNAIVFAASGMKVTEMMKAGLAMNLICVLVISIMINTLGAAMFDIMAYPHWVNSSLCYDL